MSLLPAEQHWCQQWRISKALCLLLWIDSCNWWLWIWSSEVCGVQPSLKWEQYFYIACGMFNILRGVTFWHWLLNLKQHCIIPQDCITMSWLDIPPSQDNAQSEDGFSTGIAKCKLGSIQPGCSAWIIVTCQLVCLYSCELPQWNYNSSLPLVVTTTQTLFGGKRSWQGLWAVLAVAQDKEQKYWAIPWNKLRGCEHSSTFYLSACGRQSLFEWDLKPLLLADEKAVTSSTTWHHATQDWKGNS